MVEDFVSNLLSKLNFEYEVIFVDEKNKFIIKSTDLTRALVVSDCALEVNRKGDEYDIEFLNLLDKPKVSVILTYSQTKAIKKLLSISGYSVLIEISHRKMKLRSITGDYEYNIEFWILPSVEGETISRRFKTQFIKNIFNIIKENDSVEIGFVGDYVLRILVHKVKENKMFEYVVAGLVED